VEVGAEAEAEGKCPLDHRNPKIPKRPHAHRVESSRIEGFRRSQRRSIPSWLDADDMVKIRKLSKHLKRTIIRHGYILQLMGY
jgi:hypothetical protein